MKDDTDGIPEYDLHPAVASRRHHLLLKLIGIQHVTMIEVLHLFFKKMTCILNDLTPHPLSKKHKEFKITPIIPGPPPFRMSR